MKNLKVLRPMLCCFLFLCMWELCARVDDNIEEGAPLFGNYTISSMLGYDNDGVVGRPYGHFGKWKLNALGFRGPDVRANTLKIICIGASETFGMGESAGMEYPRQLERILHTQRPDLNVEVVNVAYAGQSLRTFSRRVDKTVDALSPRVAVLYPSFFEYLDDATTGHADSLEWVREPRGFHSRIMSKLLPLIDHLPQWAENMRYRYHIWRALQKTQVVAAAIPQSHVEQFRSDLKASLDRLQARNIRPVLVTHATFFGESVEPEEQYMLNSWRRFQPGLADGGWLDAERRMNEVVRQEAHARHLTLIEAAGVLSGPENFTDPVHFTNHGANRIANLVADRLIHSEFDNVSRLQWPEHAQPVPWSSSSGPARGMLACVEQGGFRAEIASRGY